LEQQIAFALQHGNFRTLEKSAQREMIVDASAYTNRTHEKYVLNLALAATIWTT